MITLHIEADTVEALHADLRKLLPSEGTPRAVQATVDSVLNTADVDADKIGTPFASKKTRAKKQPIDTAPQDNSGATPAAFAEAQESAPAAEAPPEMSLDDMRKAMNDFAAKKGMPEVAKLLNSFKQPDGSPCQKASQVQPAERAVLAAKCAELSA